MSFWEISLPIFGALLAHSIVMEIFGFVMSAWMARKQAKLMKEMGEKVASGEINPMEIMKQFGSPGDGVIWPRMPEGPVSGTLPTSPENRVEHGQYL